MPKHPYGCRPDVPDIRDVHFRELRRLTAAGEPGTEAPGLLARLFPCLAKPKPGKLPKRVDLTEGANAALWPPIYDQGYLGSCTAQAHTREMHCLLRREGEEPADCQLSRLMLYGEERNWVREDTGASVRDGMKAMARAGCCPESVWPHDLRLWKDRPGPRTPTRLAGKRKGHYLYARLTTRAGHEASAWRTASPLWEALHVYESLEERVTRANSTVVPLPAPRQERLEGWHCGVLRRLRR
jgi:hypothetical protein